MKSRRVDWREELPEPQPGASEQELESYAEYLLRKDAQSEVCECGVKELHPQARDEDARCAYGHSWVRGTRPRHGYGFGTEGSSHEVLMDEHLATRHSHEIYLESGVVEQSYGPQQNIHRTFNPRQHEKNRLRRSEAGEDA